MLLNKHSFDIPARFAGQNDARYMLKGVQVTSSHVVGTDGHMLCLLAHQTEHKADDFPACGQSTGEPEEIRPFVVDAEAWAKVAKQLPKSGKRSSMPIVTNALLDTSAANKNGSVPLHVTDLENPQTISLKKMDGTYPDYERVIPKEEPEYTICVNPAYLEKIGKAYKDLGETYIHIALHGQMRPLVFTRAGTANDKQEMTVVLMPINSPGATGQNTQAVLRQYAESVEREHEGFWEQF